MGVFDIFRKNSRLVADEPSPSGASVSGMQEDEGAFTEAGEDGFTEFSPSQYGDSQHGPLSIQNIRESGDRDVKREQRVRRRVNAKPGTRVLIIDDSAEVVRGLRRLMRQNELEPIEALGGERGVELAFALQPELIFLAVAMQDQSGFSVLRTLRRDERTRDVPVIMMSGNKQAIEAGYVRRMGADDFMTKPISRSDLFHRIERLLDSTFVPRRKAEPATIF